MYLTLTSAISNVQVFDSKILNCKLNIDLHQSAATDIIVIMEELLNEFHGRGFFEFQILYIV